MIDGSRAMATEENCHPATKSTLTLTQTLTLTGGNFPRGKLSGYHDMLYFLIIQILLR